MPYLNWKATPMKLDFQPDPTRGHRLAIHLAQASDAAVLLAELQAVFQPGASELRSELPEGWTIFWKMRDGDSKVLLARPNTSEWVATVVAHPSDATRLLDELRALQPGKSFSLHQLGLNASPTNLDLVIGLS